MDHPILVRIMSEGFTPLGWFAPERSDQLSAKQVVLIGNAGPQMFRRFMRERKADDSLDEWTRAVIDPLADDLGAKAVYPFDQPFPPFLTWARKAGAGHVSPLGLNIHPTYGLWHAYRAALLFPVEFDFASRRAGAHPCESCAAKPCLTACPVSAFDGTSYDVKSCGQYLHTDEGAACMTGGCKARMACPVGIDFRYENPQVQFHMKAFKKARGSNL
jgi:epoxyqueuosine reductase QueG